MVKIAIAGASSELAREILDRLAATGKHDITALVRKDPSGFPELPGVKWIQTDYANKSELVQLFRGVETVLSFLAVHLDPGNETQKRIIDAAVEAGVKRFAPSEWGVGTKLADCLDVMSWYSGKIEIREYLKNVNSEKKVLEYTLFQPGGFMDYLCHPFKTAKYITTTSVNIDFDKKRALVVEGTLDDEITYTSVEDIANIVTRAIEYEGEWPVIGGISGNRVAIRQLLQIGEELRGEPFAIEWLKMEDLAAGELKTDNYPRLPLPSVPQDQVEAFSKMVVIGTLTAFHRGAWTVSDEWNQIFPDYKFTKADELLKSAWEGKN
ncbi:2`-hydroxyisoflavone reductase [Fusarium beomiforme]|uniref:2`-hydroxyisoflavone reductase n=1 Tax=Fusarium beomiforme TaxID=44412 RepID=A0A9P5A9Z3_9HYPO|nr:2`-hydroxyisoflavone reductase [Fusarium beomiforme]